MHVLVFVSDLFENRRSAEVLYLLSQGLRRVLRIYQISQGRNIVHDKKKKKTKKKLSSNKVGLVGNFVLFLPPFPSFCSFLRQNVIGLARVP